MCVCVVAISNIFPKTNSTLTLANSSYVVTYLYDSTTLDEVHNIKESVLDTYDNGPGRRKLGINLPNAKLSCSKNDNMPSSD